MGAGRRMKNLLLPVSKLKYTRVQATVTPERQLRAEQLLTTNKRRRLNRGGCGALGGPLGAAGTVRAEEAVSTVAYAPSPLPQGGGGSPGGLVATAGMFTATSSEVFCSQTKEQRQQCITRATRPPGRELPQARQASAPRAVSACWAPACFPTLPGTRSMHRGQLYMEPLWVKHTRERQTEKAGDCGNSPGSGGPVSTSVYVPSTSIGSAGRRGI